MLDSGFPFDGFDYNGDEGSVGRSCQNLRELLLNFPSDEVQGGASNVDTSPLFPCSPTEPSTIDHGSHTIVASSAGGHNPTPCNIVSSPSGSNDITNNSKSASDDSEQRLTCSCGKSFSRSWQLKYVPRLASETGRIITLTVLQPTWQMPFKDIRVR